MKVNLYYNKVKVKSVRIKGEYDRNYKVTIWNHKKLFGLFKITTYLKPIKILDLKEKEVDLDCIIYEGVPILEGGTDE